MDSIKFVAGKGRLAVLLMGLALAACSTTAPPLPPSGPNYDAVFETKHGVLLSARATEQSVYEQGAVRRVAATAYLIRERGTGDVIEVTTTGESPLREGDPVVVVYGPETRVVLDH